ncbi:hypothetical protein TWF694_005348 [Orbilia ellipsospora]|uniref:F-box domain-containing protein n=1 Tax=Orbilia ellipsospora TaxID=2528407 RepID=A0AAV9WSU5_9PEZI
MEATNLSYLPPEIFDIIYSYLSYDSLLVVSVCSKTDRRLSIPYLFCAIKLSIDSLKAFNNGHLSHLNHRIRHVNFSDLDCASDFLQNVIKCRLYCESLHHFPNITGLHVFFAAPDNQHTALRVAIIRAASKHSWFRSLKSLSIDYTSIPDESPYYITPETVESSLNSKELHFLNPPGRRLTDIDDIPVLESLTSASVTAMVPRFSVDRDPSSDPLALFYCHSGSTLRDLKLKSSAMSYTYTLIFHLHGISRNEIAGVLLSIRKLDITLYSFNSFHFSGIVSRFRNLEELTINAPNYGMKELPAPIAMVERIVYYHMVALRNLKRARIPWPVTGEGVEADIEILTDTMRYLTTNQEARVREWNFRPANKHGLPELEYIDFVSGYEEVDDDYWYTYGGTVAYKGSDMTIARVYRDMRVEMRTEKGHRKGLEKPVWVNH